MITQNLDFVLLLDMISNKSVKELFFELEEVLTCGSTESVRIHSYFFDWTVKGVKAPYFVRFMKVFFLILKVYLQDIKSTIY